MIRKIMWIVAAGIVVAIAAAPAALALEVVDEATGEHCGTVTLPGGDHGVGSGGCEWSVTNEGKIEIGTPFGMIDCDSTYAGRIDENGQGFIDGHNIFNCSPSTVDPCTAEYGVVEVWPVTLTSEGSQEWDICVTAFNFLTINCRLAGIEFSQQSHTTGELSLAEHTFCQDFSSYSVRAHRTWTTRAPGIEIVD